MISSPICPKLLPKAFFARPLRRSISKVQRIKILENLQSEQWKLSLFWERRRSQDILHWKTAHLSFQFLCNYSLLLNTVSEIFVLKSLIFWIVFYTLQGKNQGKKARKAQKRLAIKQQQEEEKPQELESTTKVPEAPEEEETAPAVVQTEQVRYRLVKKSDIRRDALNSSCLSSVSSYNNGIFTRLKGLSNKKFH